MRRAAREGVDAVQELAFWVSPGRGEIRPVTVPQPGPGQVLVRTLRSGVSRGTETLVFRGAVPPDQHERMRAPHQDGGPASTRPTFR